MQTASFDSSTWLLVLNPVSGRGAGLRDRKKIESALTSQGISFITVVSEHYGHTADLVSGGIAQGCRHILVAGGDGSLSEAVNGIFAQPDIPPKEIRLALVPVGTGNDWARAQALPHDYLEAARTVAAGATRSHDVGVIDFSAGGRRWFINVAGMGFDAGVIEHMPTRKLGRSAYLIGLIRQLVAYQPLSLHWRNGGDDQSAQAFVMFACIGRYCGGGMLVAPEASPVDGLLDLVLIRHMSRLNVLRALPSLFDGTLPQHPKVSGWRTERVEFTGAPGIAIEADGELVGHTPATFCVLREAVRMVVPAASL
jgi:YegS/Rv2252/BmrU family lipid kinase